MPSNSSRLRFAFLILLASFVAAQAEPKILSRDGWQAKPASLPMTKHKPVAILVHHTGSPIKLETSLVAKMKGLQRFSQAAEKLADGRLKPAWPDVPYHFYIAGDGSIAEGRDIFAVGDTNTGYDPTGYIQIAVEGNFEKEELGTLQSIALQDLLQYLSRNYGIKAEDVYGHQEKAQTACPGKDLTKKLPGILSRIK